MQYADESATDGDVTLGCGSLDLPVLLVVVPGQYADGLIHAKAIDLINS